MGKFFYPNVAANVILWLVGLAMQIGGWVSHTVAYILLGIAFAWSIGTGLYWWKNKKETKGYREGTVTTVAGQGRLFSIELPMRQTILHQLRVISSRSCVFTVMVCENASNLIDAMHSNIGIFQSHGRVVQETFRLPDWYYEDKDGGTHLHIEITPFIDQCLKPQTPVEFKVGVWFTSIS